MTPKRVRTLRVLSFNLWNDHGDVARRMAVARAQIAALDVDVIGMQEVREIDGGLRQATELARALGGNVHFAVADPASERGPIGNAVVSRLPLGRAEAIALPSPAGDPRVALAVDLDTPRGPLTFFTTHLTFELDAAPVREAQVVALDEFARRRAREVSTQLPAVLTGDFNTTPDADAIRFLTGRASLAGRGTYWRDAFARVRPHDDGYTWSSRNPGTVRYVERNRRIDYVFVGPLGPDDHGAILDARVALDQPDHDGVYPSDHFAVFAEIALDPVEPPHF